MSALSMVREIMKCSDGNTYEVTIPPEKGVKGFKLSKAKAKQDKETKKYNLSCDLNGRQSDNADGTLPKGLKHDDNKASSRGTLFDNLGIELLGISLEELIECRMNKSLYDIDSLGWEKFIASGGDKCNLELYATKGEGRSKIAEHYKRVLAIWKKAAEGAGHAGTLADGVTKLTHSWLRGIELNEGDARHGKIVEQLTEHKAVVEAEEAKAEEESAGLEM